MIFVLAYCLVWFELMHFHLFHAKYLCWTHWRQVSDIWAKMVIASIPVIYLYKINGRVYFSRNNLERSLCWSTHGGVRLYVSGDLCWGLGQVQQSYDTGPFCPHAVPQTPVVAIMTTGGGMRSLTALYGSLRGLKKLNVLDCATYLTGLSGTTWWVGLGSPAGVSLMTPKCWRRLGLVYSSLPVITSQQFYFLIFFQNWQNKVVSWGKVT